MTSEVQKKIDRYVPAAFEAKWRERWASSGFHNTPDVSAKPNFYFLTMFPYPSGEIHVGHWYAFAPPDARSEEHTSELQSQSNLVCRLLLEKKKHSMIPRRLHHPCHKSAGQLV